MNQSKFRQIERIKHVRMEYIFAWFFWKLFPLLLLIHLLNMRFCGS